MFKVFKTAKEAEAEGEKIEKAKIPFILVRAESNEENRKRIAEILEERGFGKWLLNGKLAREELKKQKGQEEKKLK